MKTSIKFNAGAMTKSPLINISSQWDEKDIDFGLEASKQLIAPVSGDFKKDIEAQKSIYDKAILEKQDAISSLEKQEKKNIDKLVLENQEQISTIENRIKYVDKEILGNKKEISRLEKQEKNDIDKRCALMLDQITMTSNQIKFKQEILKIINQRIGELILAVAKVENNTKKMTEQRDGLLKENPSTERLALLLYSTTIQQNMAYSNRLHDKVYNLRKTAKEVSAEIEELNGRVVRIKSEIEKIKVRKSEGLQANIHKIREEIGDLELSKKDLPSRISKVRAELETLKLERAEALQAKIDKINEQIDDLKAKKEIVRNIKLVKNPAPEPVKSMMTKTGLLSGVVGLFFFTFLTFCVEYIKRNLSKFK